MKPLEPREIDHGVYYWRVYYYPHAALDEMAEPFLELTPSKHWLRRVREASFWSQSQIAQRMATTKSNYARFELAESQGEITLNQLRRCAEALECELIYGLKSKDRNPFSCRISDKLLAAALKLPPRGQGAFRISALAGRMRDFMFKPEFRRAQGWARHKSPRRLWPD